MNNIAIIIEIIVLVILVGLNIWMMMQKKARANRTNIEGLQKMESELNRKLVNEAGEKENSSRLRPYEEKYSSDSNRAVTVDGGLRVELKVRTPVSEKKYLTTITDRVRVGADPSNELILDSQLVSGREAVLIREKNNLFFRKLNPDSEVYVERSRSRNTVGEREFRIHSQDRFYIRDVVLEIRFV